MASSSKVPADADGSQLTYNETIDAICGFIKTAIHTILCHRQVYPPNVFTRRQRYRVPVWASRHPGLNAYIEEVMDAAKAQITKGVLQSVHIILSSISTEHVVERYRFDLDFLLGVVEQRDRNLSIPGNMNTQTIEMHLRAFMQKLISLDGALSDIQDPEDLTWALVLDMKEGMVPETYDKLGSEPSQGPWVPFDDGPLTRGRKRGMSSSNGSVDRTSFRAQPRGRDPTGDSIDEIDDSSLILPVKSLDTGVINMMFYVEEHPQAKRQSQTLFTPRKPRSKDKSTYAQHRTIHSSSIEQANVGERDIDQPVSIPTSSGAMVSSKVKKRRKIAMGGLGGGAGQKEDTDTSEGESDGQASSISSAGSSGESIRSVNDFAGYAGNAGGAGMAGTRM